MCFHFGTTKGDVGDGESKTSGGAAARRRRWWKQAKQGNGGCLKLAAYHFAAAAAAAAIRGSDSTHCSLGFFCQFSTRRGNIGSHMALKRRREDQS